MKDTLAVAYVAASVLTTAYLILVAFPDFNLWNWIILVPINAFLGSIWPIYWAILYPIFGV